MSDIATRDDLRQMESRLMLAMDNLALRLTVRLGAMIAAIACILFAALRL